MTPLDPEQTALVLIDLQEGILAKPTAPRSSEAVLATARRLAERFRGAGATVVLVNVAFADDLADLPPRDVAQPMVPPGEQLPAGWSTLAAGLAVPEDVRVTKHQWGAFHGTDLDVQLRRRGVTTIVLGGIATNFGVESTARSAWEHGYTVLIVEDACASFSAELHEMAVRHIFPRIGRVLDSDALAFI